MRLIWSNAKLYNDDGSQIYLFAEALEVSSNTSFLVSASLTMEIGMVRRSNQQDGVWTKEAEAHRKRAYKVETKSGNSCIGINTGGRLD
jgi:hypothetical protein